MLDNDIVNFSLYEKLNPTNQDIKVVFTPGENISNYEYRIITNFKSSDNIVINNNEPSEILLSTTGEHQIAVIMYDLEGNPIELSSGIYRIDKAIPVINLNNDDIIELPVGMDLNLMENVTSYDINSAGEKIDLKNKITTNIDDLDFTKLGIKRLIYRVEDEAGNYNTKTLVVNVVPNNSYQLAIIQYGILTLMIVLLTLLIIYRRSTRLEKRISPYGINPIRDNSLSLFDKFMIRFKRVIDKLSSYLLKSAIMKRYAERYEKYVNVINKLYDNGINYVAGKFIIALLFWIIAVTASAVQQELLSIYEMIFPLLLGFFVPDLIYISRYRLHRQKIENDLLQAITVMNNAFKSGRSIIQAVELVTTELDGPIAEEFKKMHLEISFGLGIETVFKRFADRIQLEEVRYLTASLAILNKTGGNIIKVFSSIEKTLFEKKRLQLELESLTGVSKIIVYVLITMPVLFVVFISFINPEYFSAFYSSPIGIIIMTIIALIYIVYIFVVMKTMKVRM